MYFLWGGKGRCVFRGLFHHHPLPMACLICLQSNTKSPLGLSFPLHTWLISFNSASFSHKLLSDHEKGSADYLSIYTAPVRTACRDLPSLKGRCVVGGSHTHLLNIFIKAATLSYLLGKTEYTIHLHGCNLEWAALSLPPFQCH